MLMATQVKIYSTPVWRGFTLNQARLMDAGYDLFEAMKSARRLEVNLPRGIIFRRDGWGANFYASERGTSLTYDLIVRIASIDELTSEMNRQSKRLRLSLKPQLANIN